MKISSKKWSQFIYSASAIILISFPFRVKFIIAFLTRKIFAPNSLFYMSKSASIFGALNATVNTKLRLIRGRHCILFNDGLWKERAKIETKNLDLYTDY
jgi:hypothetical protein